MVNLSPKRVGLSYEAPFLSAQFFRLTVPVAQPYQGKRQDQTGLGPQDIQELLETEAPTLGEMMKTLSGLALVVSELRGSVQRLSWVIPLIIAIGIGVISIIVAIN